jgi:hypothetical protein
MDPFKHDDGVAGRDQRLDPEAEVRVLAQEPATGLGSGVGGRSERAGLEERTGRREAAGPPRPILVRCRSMLVIHGTNVARLDSPDGRVAEWQTRRP